MIVTCPNCSLEQPRDEYCAGCGKKLNVLIEEEKKHRKQEDKKVNFILTSALLVFFISVFAYYLMSKKLHHDHQAALEQTQKSEITQQKKVVLSKTKIQRVHNEPQKTPPFPQITTAKPANTLTALGAENKVATKENKALEKDSVKLQQKTTDLQLSQLYFITNESCPPILFEHQTYEKSSDIEELLSCSHIFLEIRAGEDSRVYDEGSSYLIKTQIQPFNSSGQSQLSVNLTSDTFSHNYSFSINNHNLTAKSLGKLWKYKPPLGINPQKVGEEMLSSYAALVLLGLTPPEEKNNLYLLTTFIAP